MTKVELFEAIRRDKHVHGKSKREIARTRGVHRRYSLDVGVKVAIDKYEQHVPLARQARIAQGHDLQVGRNALYGLIERMADELEPAWNAILDEIRRHEVIGLDQTGWTGQIAWRNHRQAEQLRSNQTKNVDPQSGLGFTSKQGQYLAFIYYYEKLTALRLPNVTSNSTFEKRHPPCTK